MAARPYSRNRSVARWLVAVDRRAVFVLPVIHDAADDGALTQHVIVVIVPLAGQAGSRRTFGEQHQLLPVHLSQNARLLSRNGTTCDSSGIAAIPVPCRSTSKEG